MDEASSTSARVDSPAPQDTRQALTQLAPTAGIVKDHIFITDGAELRTIATATHMPEAMARAQWRVEDFDLQKELYRGKTSLLYMAIDRQSGTQVALKLYRKRKLSTLNRYQVEREIRIHIKLEHENIIKLYAAFEDQKNVYMVQEFAGGGDLFEDLKRNGGTIKEKYTVRDIIVPFLNALQYLHGLGIIHRDIKPENILLTQQRVIKIADFGLSICYREERPVTRAGTLDYMAPEVLICPDKRRPEENKDKVLLAYTAQVDAWAVGILCYELLVGYPPFEQESRAATYEHIMYKEPKFPAWMSDQARKFISAALCKNAAQRPTIVDLGQQPLILTYAKPVDKPAHARLPQEFLVERSARSLVSSLVPLPPQPSVTSPTTPPQLQPVGSKRPGALDTEEGAVSGASASGESPKGHPAAGAKETFKPGQKVAPSSKPQSSSGMVLDEDASYSITDFSSPHDDAAFFALPGSSSPSFLGHPRPPSQGGAASSSGSQQQQPISRMPSSSLRGLGSPLAKSRLSGVSQGGTPPPGTGLSMPQGKVSPLVRVTTGNSTPGIATEPSLTVESSGGSYIKPQGGVLSDDTQVPLARHASMSGPSGGSSSGAGPSTSGAKGGAGSAFMERPPLDKLLGASSGSAGASEEGTGEEGGSKYSKLFAKMWGSKDKDASKAPIKGQVASSMRNLQELLLAERADSLVITDSRTGSIVGAPTMQFKKPSPAAIQARVAMEAAAAASERPEKHKDRGALLAATRAAVASDDASGLQRQQSELGMGLMARTGLGTAGSARSFTTPNSPTLRKLANAPIVNKIHEYVTQHHPTSSDNST